jgi:hypothetical protein
MGNYTPPFRQRLEIQPINAGHIRNSCRHCIHALDRVVAELGEFNDRLEATFGLCVHPGSRGSQHAGGPHARRRCRHRRRLIDARNSLPIRLWVTRSIHIAEAESQEGAVALPLKILVVQRTAREEGG